ncbi:MAG: carbohydrate ABC transporter permease [Clostridia bacterium]|jgi:multiple sugar transport system permease protein|nr:carbohydrate ABC transporter permease [Clostridia bacterium]
MNKDKTRGKAKIKKIISIVIALIILGFTAAMFIMPIVLTVTNSFMTKSEITANYGKIFSEEGSSAVSSYIADKVNLKIIPDKVSFGQYITVLIKSPQYLLKFWNSVIYVIPIVIFQIIVALGASYSFARYKGKFRNTMFFIYIALMLMPYQVTLVPNYLVADWMDILNTRWSVILPGIFSPFAVFILTKTMQRIPSSIVEAAKIDGANEWKIFRKVFVPMSKNAIYSVAILLFMDYWNMVEQPLIMLQNNEDMHPLSVYLSKINAGEIGLAFAVAAIYMVLPLLLFLYSEERVLEGIASSSAIKG